MLKYILNVYVRQSQSALLSIPLENVNNLSDAKNFANIIDLILGDGNRIEIVETAGDKYAE